MAVTHRPCDMMMSTASSTRCRSDSSDVSRMRSWAGGSSSSIPVILAARDCRQQGGGMYSCNSWLRGTADNKEEGCIHVTLGCEGLQTTRRDVFM